MPSFNLLDQPWIPVEQRDGVLQEMPLLEIFERAGDIRRIAGNPLEAAVLHRLLLAILHAACPVPRDRDWADLWNDRCGAMAKAASYLRERRSVFDLYDEERPFMQHPKLAYGKKPVAVLIYDRAQGNNPIFLDASQENGSPPVRSAEAARALLVNMAFGGSHPDNVSPLNSGPKGDMYAGPLCARLIVIAQGEDLARTLLLNLQVIKEPGTPSWERAISDRPTQSMTSGPCDRYTRMTRFVRLQSDEIGSQCLRVALHMGDQIKEIDPDFPSDPMMPLYFAKDKKMKVQRLDPGKALWRSSHVLLNCREHDQAVPARAMNQIASFVESGAIRLDESVSLRVTGVSGSAQGPKTDLWRDESLPFSISLVGENRLYSQLTQAIEVAESGASKLASRLFGFAMRFIQSKNPNPKPEDAKALVDQIAPGLEVFWSQIAQEGERLALHEIDQDKWHLRVDQAVKGAYRMAVENLPLTGDRLRAEFENSSVSDTKEKSKKSKQPSRKDKSHE